MSMFHSGDLNSGISLAIQQQKLVACFVRSDDDEWSNVWEKEWLSSSSDGTGDAALGDTVGEKAVLLRIDYGSKEAGFLGAFCPITQAPTLVIIRNGQVLEKLEGGLEQGEWTERLLGAVGLQNGASRTQNIATEAAMTVEGPSTEATQSSDPTSTTASVPQNTQPASTELTSSPPLPSDSTQPQQNVQTLLQERARRLEVEKQKREAAEGAERTARANARRKEAEEAHAAHTDKGKQRATEEVTDKERARRDWIYQQKQRKDEAKRERERILNQIEADKQERRARAQRAKDAETAAGAGASSPMKDSVNAASRRTTGAGGTCSLQIRLFDGSSVRNRFPTDTTLAAGVRDWIKEAAPEGSGSADIPYTFRQILAPQPSRSIEVSEEHQTLQDLDLVPNATLVLVPVAGYTDAYAGSSAGGVMGWVYGVYNNLPKVSYYLPSFSRAYLGGTADEQEPSNVEGAAMAGTEASSGDARSESIRVKTLADQRREAEKKRTEFYNGNSSAFEGRKGDDADKDER